MHIAEGVLSPVVLGGGAVLAAAGTAIGLRKTDYERLSTAAVLSSTFFVASLVHVPVGPGSVHLLLNGLMGLFLGWTAFPALLVALALQALLLQYGGIAVLGVNTTIMAAPAVAVHYLFRRGLARGPRQRAVSAWAAGALAVAGSGVVAALALVESDDGFLISAQLSLVGHLPVTVLDGAIAACVVAYVAKARPEWLAALRPVPVALTETAP